MLIGEDVSTSTDTDTTIDRHAAWALSGPLTIALCVMCVLQVAFWAPHYMTWPWWADHDVFATMAHGWAHGELPYRDLRGNNFPGTVYLFWVLGKLFGWGRTAPLYGFDAALVVLLGVVMAAWSRRMFARVLPGVAAYSAFLTYYLSLDYALTAQRDWHAAGLATIGLLGVQAWPGRIARVASACCFGLALSIRPQAVLFVPPLMAAMMLDDTRGAGRKVRGFVEWDILVGAMLALLAVPLVMAGVLDDFLRSLRAVTYGGHYNRVGLRSLALEWVRQLSTRDLLVLGVIGILCTKVDARDRRTAIPWIIAWAAVSLYRPASPVQHAYLSHPIVLVMAVNLGILVQFLLQIPAASPAVRLVAVLLALATSVVVRPTMVNPRVALKGVQLLRQGEMPAPDEIPPGYRPNPTASLAAHYPWEDYRALLEYVRTHTTPKTRVANALEGVPALTGPTARLSAFPAESVAWLSMVNVADERAFARSLENAEDSIVVWVPGEIGYNPARGARFDLEPIVPVIRAKYQLEAKFGKIEVWRRKGSGKTIPGEGTTEERQTVNTR